MLAGPLPRQPGFAPLLEILEEPARLARVAVVACELRRLAPHPAVQVSPVRLVVAPEADQRRGGLRRHPGVLVFEHRQVPLAARRQRLCPQAGRVLDMARLAQRLGGTQRVAGARERTGGLERLAGGEKQVAGLAVPVDGARHQRSEPRPLRLARRPQGELSVRLGEPARLQGELGRVGGAPDVAGAQERLDGQLRLPLVDEVGAVAGPQRLGARLVAAARPELRCRHQRAAALALGEVGRLPEVAEGACRLGGSAPGAGAQEAAERLAGFPGLLPELAGGEVIAAPRRPSGEVRRAAGARREDARRTEHERGDDDMPEEHHERGLRPAQDGGKGLTGEVHDVEQGQQPPQVQPGEQHRGRRREHGTARRGEQEEEQRQDDACRGHEHDRILRSFRRAREGVAPLHEHAHIL